MLTNNFFCYNFSLNFFKQNASIQVVATNSNNSTKMIQSNYLNKSDDKLIYLHKTLFLIMKSKRQSENKIINTYNEVSMKNFKKLYFMILIRWLACNTTPC
jgi:hypothetical protein